MKRQRTISRVLRFHGIGLHSGRISALKLVPVHRPNHGIWIRRVDIPHAAPIEATYRNVVAAPLCTVLGDRDACNRIAKERRLGARSPPSEMLDSAIARRINTVWTVEHLLAALHAVQVENVNVELDGCEIPILDGSSSLFLQALVQNLRDVPFPGSGSDESDPHATVRSRPEDRARLLVKRQVRVDGRPGQWAELSPPPMDAQRELQLELIIDFRPAPQFCSKSKVWTHQEQEHADESENAHNLQAHAAHQHILVRDAHRVFAAELSSARTFCLESQLQGLWKQGLARGGSRRNALVFSQQRSDDSGMLQLLLQNHQHARFADEMVRHKALDVMGDLRLAGGILAATYRASQPSHALNLALVENVFQNHMNYELV